MGKLIDYAQGEVLPGFTDEGIQEGYGEKIVELLLRVPANQRQNVLAEAHRRTFKVVFRSGGPFGGKHEEELIKGAKSTEETIGDILAENGW